MIPSTPAYLANQNHKEDYHLQLQPRLPETSSPPEGEKRPVAGEVEFFSCIEGPSRDIPVKEEDYWSRETSSTRANLDVNVSCFKSFKEKKSFPPFSLKNVLTVVYFS